MRRHPARLAAARLAAARLAATRLAAALLAAALALLAPPARARDMQPGRYEASRTTSAAPGQPPQVAHDTNCLKPEEATNPEQQLLAAMTHDGCTLGTQHVEDGHVVADYACTVQGKPATKHVDVTFTATTIEGTIVLVVGSGAAAATNTMTVSAHRVGDCP
jgi:hypothetical protein